MTPAEVVFNALKKGFKTMPAIANESFYSYDTIASAVRRLRDAGVIENVGYIREPRKPLIKELALTGKPLHKKCKQCSRQFEVTALNEQSICRFCER